MSVATSLHSRLIGLALLAVTTASAASQGNQDPPSSLANVEVLIIRHAERDGILDKLTRAGVARSAAYVRYFQDLKLDGRSIHLTHLIAEKSVRTRHTLEPLAKAMNVPLDTRFSTSEYANLAADLRTHSYGPEVLICWHHSKMADLVKALGGDAEAVLPNGKWPKRTYDWIIDLRFNAAGKLSKATESLVHEHLMPGDEN